MSKDKKRFVKQIREAIANYMQSEGCSCCRDIDAHIQHKMILAKLLRVPKYEDGSGYIFSKFRTKTKEDGR